MYSTKHMEDLQISYISALCASVGIDYDIQAMMRIALMPLLKRKSFCPTEAGIFPN